MEQKQQELLLECFILCDNGEKLKAVKLYADTMGISPVSDAITEFKGYYEEFCGEPFLTR